MPPRQGGSYVTENGKTKKLAGTEPPNGNFGPRDAKGKPLDAPPPAAPEGREAANKEPAAPEGREPANTPAAPPAPAEKEK